MGVSMTAHNKILRRNLGLKFVWDDLLAFIGDSLLGSAKLA